MDRQRSTAPERADRSIPIAGRYLGIPLFHGRAGLMQMLTKMEGFTTVTTVAATEKGHLNTEASITLTKFVMEHGPCKVP